MRSSLSIWVCRTWNRGLRSGSNECFAGRTITEFVQCRRLTSTDAASNPVLCHCGKPALLKVSRKRAKNPGLRFYTCPDSIPWWMAVKLTEERKKPHCKFFSWVDQPPLGVDSPRPKRPRAAAREEQPKRPRAAAQEEQPRKPRAAPKKSKATETAAVKPKSKATKVTATKSEKAASVIACKAKSQ